MVFEFRAGTAKRGLIDEVVVITQYHFEAKSVKAAKNLATRKLKELRKMRKYTHDKYGRLRLWTLWTEPGKSKSGNNFINKVTRVSIEGVVGFVQLSWCDRQMSFDLE